MPQPRTLAVGVAVGVLFAALPAQAEDDWPARPRKHLFGPLGIRDVSGRRTPKGARMGRGAICTSCRVIWPGSPTCTRAALVKVRDGVAYGYGWRINTARLPRSGYFIPVAAGND
jgi:hypothetical protein